MFLYARFIDMNIYAYIVLYIFFSFFDNLTFSVIKITCFNLHVKRHEKLYSPFHYYCSPYSHNYESGPDSLKNNAPLPRNLRSVIPA